MAVQGHEEQLRPGQWPGRYREGLGLTREQQLTFFWKAVTKPLGKVIGILGNLEAFSPFHFIFFNIGGGGVAGGTKKS